MQVLDFYALTPDEQHFWLEQISKTKWDAADFLISIILKEEFYSTLGNDSKLYKFLGRSAKKKEGKYVIRCSWINEGK